VRQSERARIVAGKYQLEKLLGQGGMGEVWVGKEIATGRELAVKLLNAAAADSKEHRARFEREAHIAKTLVSPHIAQVTDSGLDEDDKPFMVLELLHGEDLQKRIKTDKALPIGQVVRLAIQVGRALHVAHSAGLVHRDLKPANIFLARQGDDEIVKVLDFGIAKTGAMDSTQYTAAGAMLGTASYMSPEQIRNAKTVDHRADLWAFAVVLFRALTGELPFEQTGFDLFLALAQDPIPVPRKVTSLVPSLPAPLNVFFERSFVRELDQRYPNASAMVVGFCRAAGVTVPADVLYAADAPMPSAPISSSPQTGPRSSNVPVSAPASPAFSPAVPDEPLGLSGTMVIDAPHLDHPGDSARRPVPAAGRPGEMASASMQLDPDEPDNAATLFYQPSPQGAPPGPPEANASPAPGFGTSTGRQPVFTYPLDAARAGAGTLPPGGAPPPADARASHPSYASLSGGSQPIAPPGTIFGTQGVSGAAAPRAPRLWLWIAIGLALALGAGAAVSFLVP